MAGRPASPPLLLLKGNAALFRLVPGYGLSFWCFEAKVAEKNRKGTRRDILSDNIRTGIWIHSAAFGCCPGIGSCPSHTYFETPCFPHVHLWLGMAGKSFLAVEYDSCYCQARIENAFPQK